MKEKMLLLLILAANSISPAEYHLARAIAGERPELVSPNLELAERVGQVVLNRLDAGWCNSITHCIDTGFWGAATIIVPPQWATEAARSILEQDETTEDFYVFSREDRERLDLEEEDANFWECSSGNKWCLYFYSKDTQW